MIRGCLPRCCSGTKREDAPLSWTNSLLLATVTRRANAGFFVSGRNDRSEDEGQPDEVTAYGSTPGLQGCFHTAASGHGIVLLHSLASGPATDPGCERAS